MSATLRKILTPTTSLDILSSIQRVTSPTNPLQARRPYTISPTVSHLEITNPSIPLFGPKA